MSTITLQIKLMGGSAEDKGIETKRLATILNEIQHLVETIGVFVGKEKNIESSDTKKLLSSKFVSFFIGSAGFELEFSAPQEPLFIETDIPRETIYRTINGFDNAAKGISLKEAGWPEKAIEIAWDIGKALTDVDRMIITGKDDGRVIGEQSYTQEVRKTIRNMLSPTIKTEKMSLQGYLMKLEVKTDTQATGNLTSLDEVVWACDFEIDKHPDLGVYWNKEITLIGESTQAHGKAPKIRVEEIMEASDGVLRSYEEAPTLDGLVGSLPGIWGGKSARNIIKSLRGGEE